jgi:hypothetical protein
MRGATTAKRVLDVLAGADRGQGVDSRAVLTVVPGEAADITAVIDGLVGSGFIHQGSPPGRPPAWGADAPHHRRRAGSAAQDVGRRRP